MGRRGFRAWVLSSVVVFLAAGCGSSVKEGFRADTGTAQRGPWQVQVDSVTSSTDKVPSHVVQALKSYLEQELKQKGLLQPRDRQVGLRVNIKDYRDRGAVARFMLGVLAGSDNMESTVELADAQGNQVIARSDVKSFNATAIGDMDFMAKLHAEEIAKYVQQVAGSGPKN